MADERVFGMGSDPLVEPDWPPLTPQEIADLLGVEASIEWRSPRPLSATARVRRTDGKDVIVKRLPSTLRDAAALEEEHGFMNHLRGRGIPVPEVLLTREHGDFTYEVQELGTGEDLYRGAFSWSPYHSLAQAESAGRMLAQLHLAAAGYDAPARPPHPLLASFTIFSGMEPLAAVERFAAVRPELALFLTEREWRADIERVHLPFHAGLYGFLDGIPPLWTHNDWHGTNLLWEHETPSAVIDFGLCDRTTAIHDVAMAIERSAVDWISLRGGGPANVRVDQVDALLRGYESVRPLQDLESLALPELLPLVHAEYELSEIDYFLSVVPGGNQENAEIAYRDYFLGHTEWWAAEGAALITHLRQR
ncbi:phosphotransferase enzyme family protein [Nocardia huaxiensis]|uniref:phosphotransferase enzyme family protein n=1 Tax=Nocardia huaxiensis TaxID=2755382 RepID=UPI001E4DAB0B|nr:phosphotransferase [Nocardia huaxiensis]UFS94285.1 phosphotransferase [Nocardia huaxiensis]